MHHPATPYFCLTVSFFLFFQIPGFPSISRLLHDCSEADCDFYGGLAVGMAESSSPADRRHLPPYTVMNHIERYGAHLDGRRLAAMRLTGDAKEIRYVHPGHMCNTAVGAWTKGWWHWG